MPDMSNAREQCAHRWYGMGRCPELAITTRPIEYKDQGVMYDVPLCESHSDFFDQNRVRVKH
jgi:hypothetical protein